MAGSLRELMRQIDDDREVVLVIAKGYPPTTGGVERYSEQVVAAYRSKGYVPIVLTQTEGRSGWSVRQTSHGAYAIWNSGPGGQGKTFLRMLWRSVSVRRSIPIRCVHVTTWRVGLIARIVFRRATMVVTVHGREVLNFPWFLKPVMLDVLSSADIVLAVSAASQAAARSAMGRRRTHGQWLVAYNGLTHSDTAAAVSDADADGVTVRLLSLSRLVARKNVSGCLESLAKIRAQGIENFEYLIAGKGPLQEELEARATELGLADHVKFLGYVTDDRIPELYRWADVFLHPHTHVGDGRDFEGFGLVIADAMSFGCAVVVGDIGGPRELVTHGDTGILVDGSDLQSLTAAILTLLTDPEARRRIGIRAQQHAFDHFSWSDHVQPAVDAFAAGREA